MTKILFSILVMLAATTASANYTVCASGALVYKVTHYNGGPQPPPGTAVGSVEVIVGDKIADQYSIYNVPGHNVTPACTVNFNDATRKNVYTDPAFMGKSIELVDMEVKCDSGAAKGTWIHDNVTCTTAHETAP